LSKNTRDERLDTKDGKPEVWTPIWTPSLKESLFLFAGNHSQVGIERFSGMSLLHLINTILHQKDIIFW